MKPRLFWTMLLAFVLVIVLGVCGMLGFLGLAFSGIWQPTEWGRSAQDSQDSYADTLGDYYVAHGDSWQGVGQRLERPLFRGPAGFLDYALLDAGGKVLATNDGDVIVGSVLDGDRAVHSTAVMARGTRVGTLVMLKPNGIKPDPPAAPAAPGAPSAAPIPASRPPVSFVWSLLRGFVFAGLGLGGVLLALAAFFAQRLSRPIRGITAAAQALAAGKLDAHAPGAHVRELDDLAQAFNHMAQALAQADRQRRQMTADVAHELRTPLTIIKGRLEGLQDGVYSATPVEIERLLGETALLERLIEDLRLLALAEAGQLPLYTEALDPQDLLQSTANAFASQAAQQGVALHVEAPDDLPQIEADPQRMSQVFANLVANALRYTPSGGTIALRASADHRPPYGRSIERPDDHRPLYKGEETQPSVVGRPSSVVIFEVADSGHGIAPDDLPHIFDRFYRADRSRARGSGGAGLGLAITKQIVAAHGGTIWAESAVGQGTTIGIALPLAIEHVPELV